MISISKDNYEKILAHAEKNLPEEACGLIAGRIEGSDKHIEKVYLLTNIDHSDKRLAYDSRASYLILSLMDHEHPVLNSFHIEGDIATNEGLVIG